MLLVGFRQINFPAQPSSDKLPSIHEIIIPLISEKLEKRNNLGHPSSEVKKLEKNQINIKKA